MLETEAETNGRLFKMGDRSTEIARFKGTSFALWKLKMQAISVKDGSDVVLGGKEMKSATMMDRVCQKRQ